MKIAVKVKAGAKAEKIEKISEDKFSVWVREKPQDGKANYAVRELLANYFNIPKSRIILMSGETAKNKIFEIFI